MLLGGILYLGLRGDPVDAPECVVIVDRAQQRELVERFASRLGRPPTRSEFDAQLQRHIDDALLLEEAFALGWHRSDPIVHRRLIQNQRFLDPETREDDRALLERAYAQQMDRSDVVVQRRLRERVRLGVEQSVRGRTIDASDLEAQRQRSADRHRIPDRVRVTQIFLSRDRRGTKLEEDARALAERLQRTRPAPDRARDHGDPSLLEVDLPLWSEERLAARFGPDFAADAMAAPVGAWSGPIASSYGRHFVFVHERAPGRLPEVADLEYALRAEIQERRGEEALEAHLRALRTRCRVEVQRGGVQHTRSEADRAQAASRDAL